jgi:hypothetical protein
MWKPNDMWNKSSHLTDEDLLMMLDGELSTRRIARMRRHLAACWNCRARMAEIEGTIGDFVHAHQASEPELPPIAGPRALLKARMAEIGQQRPQWPRLLLQTRSLAYVWALVLVVALGGGAVYRQYQYRQRTKYESAAAGSALSGFRGLLPDPNLTPGATRPIAMSDICLAQHDQVVLSVSNPVRQRVFQEYGMRDASANSYEVDYLITPGLGGSDDIRNLWPEPHDATEWNSYVKDQLEDRLHQLVCSRKITLEEAQREIAMNWISAYKKYFQTDKPLLNYSIASTLDLPDGLLASALPPSLFLVSSRLISQHRD